MPRRNISAISVAVIAIAFVLFQLYTAGAGTLPFLVQRPIHLIFALVLTFILVDIRGKENAGRKIPIWDWALIVLSLISISYVLYNSQLLMSRSPLFRHSYEFPLALTLLLVILETGRRRIGITFPILTVIAVAYTVWGDLIPGFYGHSPISFKFMLESLYFSSTGIFGLLIGLSATVIAMFIIFGAFMLFTEGGQTLVDLATCIGGRMWGGGAKVAAISSAFFGMISGSAIANTAATGNFTIPLMKQLGYRPEFAGAVEATASTGGIFTPPVMGATAFILAEFTGLPYVRIMGAAVIPAFLFYFGIFFAIDSNARRMHLSPVPPELIPSLRKIFTWSRMGPVAIPVAILVGLLIRGFSPFYAAYWGCLAAVLIYLVTVRSFAQLKERFRIMLGGLEDAGKTLGGIVPLLACAAMVIGLINLTGIGIKFSQLVVGFGQGNLLLALILGAVVSIILGMGLPAAAAYVLAAAVVAPGLEELGVIPLAAHMFIMYFACISGITPPVCPNVYVASAIAESNWLKTGWHAVKLAFIIYIIPFIFVYETPLLMEGQPAQILLWFVIATWATFLMTIGFGGFFLTRANAILRFLFFVSAFLLLYPDWQLTIAGAVVSAVTMAFLIWQWLGSRNKASPVPAT